jgi:hypothetical protein
VLVVVVLVVVVLVVVVVGAIVVVVVAGQALSQVLYNKEFNVIAVPSVAASFNK